MGRLSNEAKALMAEQALTGVRETPVRQTKQRRSKGGAGRTVTDLPNDIVDTIKYQFGQSLQWVTDSIHGQPTPQIRAGFESDAWEPVTPDMFDGILDGCFTRKGHKGEIENNGLVLMYRPVELTEEAEAEQRQIAREARQGHERKMKMGQIDGVSFDTQHPSARANTRLTREIVAGIPEPRD